MQDFVPLAVAYYMNGVNFKMSAKTLADEIEVGDEGRPSKITAIPLYFLASHAAELFLKAALLKRGFQEATLKKFDYRHNLSGLLAEIQAKGLPVTDDTAAVVQGLSKQHECHQLRYTVLVDDGTKAYWPPLPMVFSALDELLSLCRISTYGF